MELEAVVANNMHKHSAEWFKNGERVQPTDRIQIKQIDKKYILAFKAVEIEDEGDYELNIGSHSTKCHMTVNERNYFLPLIITKPTNCII